jgi:hypothetical protein
MKKLFVIWALTAAGVAYAGCSSHSYSYNGRYVYCTTCCDSNGNNCNTFCN